MLFFVAGLMVFPGCSKEKSYPSPSIKDNEAIIDLGSMKEDVPSFFTLAAEDGQKIHFFVVKKKGTAEVYFDACEKCYYRKKGYTFRDGALVCKDCNISFEIGELSTGLGSCRPVPIKSSIKNSTLLISLDELKKGKRFF